MQKLFCPAASPCFLFIWTAAAADAEATAALGGMEMWVKNPSLFLSSFFLPTHEHTNRLREEGERRENVICEVISAQVLELHMHPGYKLARIRS